MFKRITDYIKELYGEDEKTIPLHEPTFMGNEKEYLLECINTNYVSSVGKFVDQFEDMVSEYTGSKYAVATVNGTAALHLSLLLSGVNAGDEVITQAITFVATANAITYCGAHPVFLDSDRETLGLSPASLKVFLEEKCIQKDNGYTYNRKTNRKISACLPMHVLGHPVRIDLIKNICDSYNIILLEDAAESIGSLFNGRHTGTFGKLGILSFNGNKTITTGGGGMILTDDDEIGKKAKHLSTTAKVPHPWEYVHDHTGFNYRLPNINAAIGCAQMEQLSGFIEKKRTIAMKYKDFFNSINISFVDEPEGCYSNFWLNAIILYDRKEKNDFLEYSNANGVMTRPLWTLMNDLQIYSNCEKDSLENAKWLEERVVCIPSSVGNNC